MKSGEDCLCSDGNILEAKGLAKAIVKREHNFGRGYIQSKRYEKGKWHILDGGKQTRF